jgi:phosphatidate cytidylyltransferase
VNNFTQRTITGIVFVAVLVGATIAHPLSLFALFFIISSLSIAEFYTISTTPKVSAHRPFGQAINGLLHAVAFLNASGSIGLGWFLALIPLILIFFSAQLYRQKELPFSDIALTLLGNIYISVPFIFVYYIVLAIPMGDGIVFSPQLMIAMLIMVWTNDTGAYLSGRSFGKHKLFERISPKKTWEGAIGGTLLVVGASYLISLWIPQIALIHWIALGIICSVTANFGDLFESMLKRSLNVKDSGTLLPGHGGMLDRFDGVIFAIPAFFIYLHVVNL